MQKIFIAFMGVFLTTQVALSASLRPEPRNAQSLRPQNRATAPQAIQSSNNASHAEPVQPDKVKSVKEETENVQSDANKLTMISELSATIKQLQDDLVQMDMEIRRCGRARSDWRTATIIGGIGVVGTATGAIIQGVQLNKAKKENIKKSTDAESKE